MSLLTNFTQDMLSFLLTGFLELTIGACLALLIWFIYKTLSDKNLSPSLRYNQRKIVLIFISVVFYFMAFDAASDSYQPEDSRHILVDFITQYLYANFGHYSIVIAYFLVGTVFLFLTFTTFKRSD